MPNELKFTPSSNGASAGPLGARPNLKFTPALSVIEGKRAKEKFKEFNLTWWEPNSFFKYNAMLCSAFYGMKDKWNYREDYGIPKDFLLIGDSGGFEQATQKTITGKPIRIEALEVINWQKNNVDIGFTLDIPPVNPENLHFEMDNVKLFRKCAEQSKRNAEIAHRNLGNSNMKLYSVLQGHIKEQLDTWSKGKLDLTDFDGTALSHKSSHLIWLSVQAMYVKEHEVKNIHVLTGTGYNSVPLIVYLRKHFKQVTFDSSSYGMGARNMAYNLPYRYKIFFGRSYNGKVKRLLCDCPICKNISIEDLQTGTSISGALLSLHNLYNYIQHVNFLDVIVDDDELFENYIKRHTNKKTQRAFKFIKMCEEKGFEDTYRIFNIHLHKPEPILKQVNPDTEWF